MKLRRRRACIDSTANQAVAIDAYSCACTGGFFGEHCESNACGLQCGREVLLAFKQSGNGIGLESWATGGDPCIDSWAGVTCSEGLVTGLDRSGSGQLTGDLGTLVALATLSDLNLDGTAVEGDLADIGGLSLISLELQGTAITGNLRSLADMTALTTLNVGGASCTGDLRSLTSLTALTILKLGAVPIAGDLSTLAGMPTLTILDLGESAVVGSLISLAGNTALAYLDLHNTAITGDVAEIGAMTALTTLSLHHTAVTGDVSNLVGLAALTDLHLDSTAANGWPLVITARTVGFGCTFEDANAHRCCTVGFTFERAGDHCIDTDECASGPCQHGGCETQIVVPMMKPSLERMSRIVVARRVCT